MGGDAIGGQAEQVLASQTSLVHGYHKPEVHICLPRLYCSALHPTVDGILSNETVSLPRSSGKPWGLLNRCYPLPSQIYGSHRHCVGYYTAALTEVDLSGMYCPPLNCSPTY